MILFPIVEEINENLNIVWFSDETYVKIMFHLAVNSIILQQGEDNKHYLLCLNRISTDEYQYEYYEGYTINDSFYKKKKIFQGKFWQAEDAPFVVMNWLYTVALMLAIEEDLSFPVNCLAQYGQDSPYKLTIKDDSRVIN